LVSEGDEDPLFSDDWDASTFLYPSDPSAPQASNRRIERPPITLLVISVGNNVLFDPSKEELAVAEGVLAVSVGEVSGASNTSKLQLLSIRSVDPPARLTPSGIPNALNPATGGTAPTSIHDAIAVRESMDASGVWSPPRGGIKRGLLGSIVKVILEENGVASEVLEGLNGVDN